METSEASIAGRVGNEEHSLAILWTMEELPRDSRYMPRGQATACPEKGLHEKVRKLTVEVKSCNPSIQ